jgi:hypothetical protein
MTKRLVGTLVTASLIISCSGLIAGLSTSRAIAVERENAEPSVAKPSTIEVTFEGLMILHRQASGLYEIGILIPEIAHKHTFIIKKDGEKIENLSYYVSLGMNWVLEVIRPSGEQSRVGMSLRNRGHSKRFPDNSKGQFDFSWAVDLEGPEFHNRLLTLEGGKLKPIIQLPNGELYTKYKSPFVQRQTGPKGPFLDFGFVAETTALKVDLQPGEELVLRVEKDGPDEVIFRLPYGSPHQVAIHNPPDPPDKPIEVSHFKLYYGLFSNVPEGEHFDFKLKKPKQQPFNEYPLQTIYGDQARRWVDSLPCGLGLLGKRTARLE